MGNLSDALDLVVEDADRCFTTKRKTPRSRVEVVETSFDHALTVLKLYELTGDSQYLQRWMNYVFENAFFDECGVRWNFSPLVTDKPADADSTAMNLLYLTVAKNQGVDFDPRYSASSNLAQFKDLVSELGGVETFFGLKRDVDPIVNTTLAFLYHLNPASDEQRKSITNYLRKQTMQLL